VTQQKYTRRGYTSSARGGEREVEPPQYFPSKEKPAQDLTGPATRYTFIFPEVFQKGYTYPKTS